MLDSIKRKYPYSVGIFSKTCVQLGMVALFFEIIINSKYTENRACLLKYHR